MTGSWRVDPTVAVLATAALACYAAGVRRYSRVRARRWPRARTVAFALGVGSAVVAIESPLDTAGDRAFVPHMVQHLVLTDVAAPLVLLGAPLLLTLAATPTSVARRVVRALASPVGSCLAHPLVAWFAFVSSLWSVHVSGFFEAALASESVHVLEHGIFFTTALLFWSHVVAIGPAPWAAGPLAYPIRMLYVFLAMPAEALLGFAIFGSRHVLYPSYRAAGLADQRDAGELMWIGGTLAMFVAFMFVGYEWSRDERRREERAFARGVG